MSTQINNTLQKTPLAKKLFNKDMITVLIVVVFYGVYSTLVYTDTAGRQMLNMAITISCYILMAVSLNLVVGFLGELSLGHAGFMCVGAYLGCYLAKYMYTFTNSPLLISLKKKCVVKN